MLITIIFKQGYISSHDSHTSIMKSQLKNQLIYKILTYHILLCFLTVCVINNSNVATGPDKTMILVNGFKHK